jgi:SAM-dependent methyltransferase
MNINEAIALIRTPLIEWAQPQSWCDLGSGSGTFTVALAQLLAPGSTIYAVDFDHGALERVPDQHNRVEIRKIVGDLQSSSLRLPSVAGILMANTLHFIQEQQIFLKRLRSVADRFLIVEYEQSKPNRWRPYPSGRFRKTPPTLHRGRSRTSGETDDKALAIWWHDVLGLRRTIQSTIMKTRPFRKRPATNLPVQVTSERSGLRHDD